MLEQFKVPEDMAVHVQEDALRETVTSVFKKMGVSDADSELATDVLVVADMRGVETHGVSNMLRAYVSGYGSGEINNNPNWRITRETPATANIDSDRGLGIIVTPKAMEIAIEKAKNVGVGMVTIHNSRHLGMASYHAMMALEHDQIGLVRHVLSARGAADVRRGAASRHEPDRGGRARRQRAAFRLRRGHQHGRRQQAGACPQTGQQAATGLGSRLGGRSAHGRG